ncbi:MAG: hypothetical protein PHC53_00215 [Patescibacteria group bacterium]|nr:hypothetical protein [Patescibacteria group bacterium]
MGNPARFFLIIPSKSYPTQSEMEALRPGDSLRFTVVEGDLKHAASSEKLDVELTPVLHPGGYRVDEDPVGVWHIEGTFKINGEVFTGQCLYEVDPEACKQFMKIPCYGHSRGLVQINP